MASHAKSGVERGSRVNYAIRPVIPALPIRPVNLQFGVKKPENLAPVQSPVEQDIETDVPPCECSPQDHVTRIQFGQVEGDHEQTVDSPRASNQTNSSVVPVPSPLHSGKSASIAALEIDSSDMMTRDISKRQLKPSDFKLE